MNEAYAEFSLPLLQTLGCQRRGALLGLLDLRQHNHLQGRPALAADRRLRAPRHLLDRIPRAEPRRALRPDAVRRHAGRSVRSDGRRWWRRATTRRWRRRAARRACRTASSRPTRRSRPSPAAIRTWSPRSPTATPSAFVYNASWAQGTPATDRLNFEATYYNHKIKGAIQAEDIQALLNACLAAGGHRSDAVRAFHARRGRQPESAAELPGEPRPDHHERRGHQDATGSPSH